MTIKRVLLKNNIYIRNRSEARQKYFYNKDFFEVIDTEEKAYWLGFIAADGNITKKNYLNKQYRLRIQLAEKDKEHLEKFNKSIEGNLNIRLSIRQQLYKNEVKEYKKCEIYVDCTKIVNDLEDKGIYENKSLILDFSKNIPFELYRHYIRGYFDGDGSFSYNKKTSDYRFRLYGTKKLLTVVKDYFNHEVKITKQKNIYRLSYGGRQLVKRILDHLYFDATIYLERKYNKFQKAYK